MWYEIGDGKTVSVRYDKWHSLCPLCNFISRRDRYDARKNDNCSVAEAVKEGVWNWPIEWFQKYPVLNIIQVPMLNASKRDKMVWKTNDGKHVNFSTSGVWKDMNEAGQNVEWKSTVWFTQ